MFEQTPDNHINGKKACSKCAKEHQTLSQIKYKELDLLLSDLNNVHGQYEYIIDVPVITRHNIKIICKTHGIFEQRLGHHLAGSGCPRCKDDKLSDLFSFTVEDFVKKAREIHGDKYDYSSVVYTLSQKKIDIICKEHGVFSQTANSHLCGNGCPSCAIYGYQPHKPAVLYILKVSEDFIKFGISNNFKRRVDEISKGSSLDIDVLDIYYFEDGTIPQEIERQIINMLPVKSVVDKQLMQYGYTETTYIDLLEDVRNLVKKYL